MKRLILIVTLLSLPAMAVNFTVKQGGGGTYTTITACINAMSAGDSCTVYAGDYSGEGVHTLTAGSVGLYKIVQANTGDTVITKEWVLNSYTKLIGLTIQDPSAPYGTDCVTFAQNATRVYSINNVVSQCGLGGAYQWDTHGGQSQIYIQGGSISYPCSPSSGSINVCYAIHNNVATNHVLIEKVDFSHTNVAIYSDASYITARNNSFHDFLTGDCLAFASGGHGSNCHFDTFFTEPETSSITAQYLLVEGSHEWNIQGGCDPAQSSCSPSPTNYNGHGFLFQGNACAAAGSNTTPDVGGIDPCSHAIARFNVGMRFVGPAVLDDNGLSSAGSPGFRSVQVYNNTWVDFWYNNPLYQVTSTYSHYSIGWADVNNLYFYPHAVTYHNPYADGDGTTTGGTTGSVYGNGMAACSLDGVTLASPCTLYNHHYGGTPVDWTTDVLNGIANIYAVPTFKKYTPGDTDLSLDSLALASGSGRGAGGYFATAVGAGTNSTSLVMSKCAPFQDGMGLDGVQGDTIGLGNSPLSNMVQISSMNYSTCTATITPAATWSNGDKIQLVKDSSGRYVITSTATQKPNMGGVPDSVGPSSLAFGNQTVGSNGAAQTVTIANWLPTSTMGYTSAALTAGTDFSISANTCSNPIAAAGTCTISVTFIPTSTGVRSDTLTIVSGAPDSPTTVALSGSGTSGSDSVTSFTAPGSVLPGQSFTLSWNATCTTASINQGIGAVACGSGSQTVSIPWSRNAVTYTLTTGDGHSASVTVTTTGTFVATPSAAH